MRAKTLVILWGVAAVIAVTIAWQGVSIVDSQVISPAPAISVDRSSSAAIPVEPSGTSTPAPTTAVGDTPAVEPETDFDLDLSGLTDAAAGETTDDPDQGEGETAQPPSGDDAIADAATPGPAPRAVPPAEAVEPTVTPIPRPTERPTATRPQQPTPTERPEPTAVPATPKATGTPAPTATPEPVQVLTFDLVGGTASISFQPGEVHVLWATPKPGYAVEISNSGPGQRVEFRADRGESRLDVWWESGAQWSIDEDHD